MRFLIRRWSVRFACMMLLAALLSGCAAGRGAFKEGEKALAKQHYDQAVASLQEAVKKDPNSYTYRLKLNDARNKASLSHKRWGDRFFEKKQYLKAQAEYQLSIDLDGSNFSAADGLQLTRKYLLAEKLTNEADELLKSRRRQQAIFVLERALEQVADYQPALQLKKKIEQSAVTIIDGFELEVTSTQPITLNFTNAKLPDVFEILTNLSGINFILDEDVRGSNTTLFLENATFAQSLELLLRMNKLDKKILNSKTIILFPKTRDKQKQFEDQLIHTFYLSNIDAKKAVNLLRTMLQVRKIYVHEELNAIIIRDSADVIKLAQKIIEANDRANSEVVFDLELLEVNHSDGLKIGPKLTSYEVQAGFAGDPLTQDSTSSVTSNIGSVVVSTFNGLDVLYGLPAASFDLLKENGNGEVLANPKVRVKNKEKAKVHIGSREPVITVTINGDQTSENVQYVDVGVKLDVEPLIQLDNTVVTKLGLEVSNVSGRSTTANGTAVLTISTTNANTALTLKDGERTIIGGLLRDSITKSKTTVPILGDIPLLGWLFTSYDESKSKSEILLSITPHIVKFVTLPEHDVASIWSGGEDDLKFGRNFGSFADEYTAGQKGLEPQADFQPPVEKIPEIVPSPGALPEPEEEQTPDVESSPAVDGQLPAEEALGGADQPEAEVVEETAPEIVTELVAPPQVSEPLGVIGPKVYVKGSELVNVGEDFSLTFYVDEVKELFSAPLYVQYDKDLFEFVSATEGAFLKQGESPTIFTHTALEGSGRIIVGLKQGAGGKGVSAGGDLFVMTFKAINAGSGIIEPSRTNFRNPNGVRLKVDTFGLTIEAQE